MPRTHRYTELATGLNFWSNGQWTPSKEKIVVLPNGTAAATNGQHQVYFPGDIAQGVIELVTPDGKQLQNRPLCLSYDDGSNTVLIAVLTNSPGYLVGANQVIYPDAFTGVKADLLYVYTKAGLEQDIILRAQPPDPAAFGLNPRTTRLQVLTEFFYPPQPNVTATVVPTDAGNLTDQQLDFGVMQMAPGKAFLLGTNSPTVLVTKQWLLLQGRQFLVEEVPVVDIADELLQLPQPVVQTSLRTTTPNVSGKLTLPSRRLVETTPKTMFMAKVSVPTRGLVLDYVILNSSTNNITFQGDTTYYISGSFNLSGNSGTNTFEGGAVLKYAKNTFIWVSPAPKLNWLASAYRPVIFTAVDDNSVGETISSSTGIPTNYYAYPALMFSSGNNPVTLQYWRVAYANYVIISSYTALTIKHSQFVNFANPLNIVGSSLNIENVLMYNVAGTVLSLVSANCIAQNLTVHNANTFFYCGPYSSLCMTNSLLIACTNLGSSFNGVYNYTNISDTGIFQTAGAGSHYLATNSPYRNAGTTNIDPQLLADLQTKTTYPPIVYSNVTFSMATNFSPFVPRDTNAAPDLGYHYDALDYVFGGVQANSNITFTAGTAVGWFNDGPYASWPAGDGISLADGVTAAFNGTATMPCWFVRNDTVQEGGNGNWINPSWLAGITALSGNNDINTAPTVQAKFTHCAALANEANAFRDFWILMAVRATDCEFFTAGIGAYYASLSLTNCLFHGNWSGLWRNNAPAGMNLQNCTFIGGHLYADHWDSSTAWLLTIVNCAFEGTDFDYIVDETGSAEPPYCDYNAFLQGAALLPFEGTNTVIVTNSFNWQSSWLGNYYQPTNSPLIDKGSESVDDAGLTGYTILTNQTPDTGTVDIGYHYQITGSDSTGTDFWLTFFDTLDPYADGSANFNLSLYISSPVAASGTITYPVNGPMLTITGDPAVSGPYVLTNTPPSESSCWGLASNMYVYGDLQVVFFTNSLQWSIWNYNNNGHLFYEKSGRDLNGSNWSNDQGTEYSITSSCLQVPFSQFFSVPAGSVTNVPIPSEYMLANYDDIESEGIHVTANLPVSVYGFSYSAYASSAFTAYPTPLLGTNYCILARASHYYYTEYSQFAIVATEDDTTVTITPSATATLAGSLWTNSFILNQGETYENNGGPFDADVTGTWITSDKPIAVFAGDNEALVPDGYTAALNPLNQEQLPVEQWGTNVVAMSFAGRLNGDTYRILSAESSNIVTISGIVVTVISYGRPWTVTTNYETLTTNLTAGVPCDLILDGPVQIQSTKPIQVAQFANGVGSDYVTNTQGISGEGDPCEVLLSPTGQWMNSYTVYSSTNDDVIGDFDENFLNLIVPQSATNSTLVDGSIMASTNFVAIGTSGYYGAQITITNAGAHTVTSSQPVGVEVYGWGLQDAYSYFGGIVK